MEIGTQNFNEENLRNKQGKLGFSNLSPEERRMVLEEHKKKYEINDDIGTISFASIVESHNQQWCENPESPDKEPPKELFNFDLILNNKKFQVVLDTLLRINKEEDLADFSEIKLKECLEKCASYKVTCFCAYISAHKEKCKWEEYHKVWMAEMRTLARTSIKNERMREKNDKARKDIGQITKEEIDDWVLCNNTEDYKDNTRMIDYWKDNEELFKEFRDTLNQRGMHLQTLLNRVDDQIAPKVSNANQIY